MKHLSLALLLAFAAANNLSGQKQERKLPQPEPFHEESSSKGGVVPAPPESIQQVRQFIRYVFRQKPEIASDQAAQQRFLSKGMRDAFANYRAVYAEYVKHQETPDLPPNNLSFVGAWDYPTRFRIVGSRRYDERAVVDVLFTWGRHTNYEGDTRLTSYCLIREQGAWKIEDIYTFNGKFIRASSLVQEFSQKTYQ